MKILRKLMKSQAIITKESNDQFRQRININTIDSEVTMRRLTLIARAAQHQQNNMQLKAALIGTHTLKANMQQHCKKGLHATIARDIGKLLTDQQQHWQLKESLMKEAVTEEAWDHMKGIKRSDIKKLGTPISQDIHTTRTINPNEEAECTRCNKTFKSAASLAAHKLRTHKQGNIYRQSIQTSKCIRCNKEFKNISTAKQHYTRICLPKATAEEKAQLLRRHHPSVPTLQRAFEAGRFQ
jgi:hypothetical protein